MVALFKARGPFVEFHVSHSVISDHEIRVKNKVYQLLCFPTITVYVIRIFFQKKKTSNLACLPFVFLDVFLLREIFILRPCGLSPSAPGHHHGFNLMG